MNTHEKKQPNPLKKAHKVLNFWYKALLASDLMNEKQHRLEYQEALSEIKKHSKQKK